jgi:putative nucleotidyltransferase with HDIG domain
VREKTSAWIRARTRRRVLLHHERAPRPRRQEILVRLALAGGLVLATLVAFPPKVAFNPPRYAEGDIAEEEVLAPFSFEVPKTSQELVLERARAAESVLPTFVPVRRGVPFESVIDRLERARGKRVRLHAALDSLQIALNPSTIRLLAAPDSGDVLLREAERLLIQARTSRLVGDEDADLLQSFSRVRILTPDGEEVLPTAQILDVGGLSNRAWERGLERLGPRGGEALSEMVRALAVPNLAYDHASTEAERNVARTTVSPNRATIAKGERIVDANERITSEQLTVLAALEHALIHGGSARGMGAILLPLAGRLLLVVVFLALMALSLWLVRPAVWKDLGLLSLLAGIVLLTVVLSGAVARTTHLHPLLVPIPFATVVVTLLLDPVLGVGIGVGLAGLVGAVSGWGAPVMVAGGVGATIAAYAVRQVIHRMDFLRAVVPLAAGMIAAVVGIHFVGTATPWRGLLAEAGWLGGNAAISIALPMFLLPLFEKVFGLASNITLLELSDLNRPIFKRMMLEANGTYHHSMIVGSLAEAAAETIGANPLLARVGGYYHDIGKIAKSGYFGENIGGGLKNPHEKLTPHMSSLILESHVRDGLELAREIGLPDRVAAFIPEHQGTTLMQYFFTKAQELDPEVDERDYRYPGPKPQSRETAVVMLADAAEATVRSLDEPSAKKIRAALGRLFEARMADGQLDDSGLSLSDMPRIREAFVHVLTGVFHTRVKYQWQRAGGEEALAESKGRRVFHPELETGIGSREAASAFAGSSAAAGRIERH